MSILLWVLIILIGVPLILAFTPVRYRAALSYDAGFTARVTVSYLLHIFHMTVEHMGSKTETVVRIAGIRIKTDGGQGEPSPRKQKREKVKERETFKLNADSIVSVLTHPDLKTIIGLILELFKKMIGYMLPRKFDVAGTVGFEDPYNTGILIGAFDGVFHALNKHRHIMINGDFEKAAFKLDIKASGRLSAAGAIAPLIWFVTRRPIFKLIIGYLKRNRSESKKTDKDDENVLKRT